MTINFHDYCEISEELPVILEERRKKKLKSTKPPPIVKYPQRVLRNSKTAHIIKKFLPKS